MAKTVILETNVLYDIGLNRIRIEDVRQPGEHLCYSPISIIELVSKLNDRSFEDRKAAANVILKHRIDELPDPESHLTKLFGYKLAKPAPSYSDTVRALATGQNLEEIRRGVPDDEALVQHSLHVPFTATWREKAEQEWVDSLISLMEENIPGFQKWYAKDPKKRSSSVPKLRGEKKKKFLYEMKSREWFSQVISACQMRAFFKADNNDLRVVTKQKVNKLTDAITKIEFYAHMYTYYLIRLMTEGLLPKKNDSGDIDFFLYSTDDDHVVATNEKKWSALADTAGFSHRIRKYGLNKTAQAKDWNSPEENAARYHIMRDAATYRKMSFKDYIKVTQAEDWNWLKESAATYRKMSFEDYIEPRPFVRSGKFCFKGTRITVYDILEYLAGGMTEDELLVDFPDLTPQHIRAARDFSDFHNLQLAPSSNDLERVVSRDPEIHSGDLVFSGTRVPVDTLVDYLKGGDNIEEFLKDFPTVTRWQVESYLEVSFKALDHLGTQSANTA